MSTTGPTETTPGAIPVEGSATGPVWKGWCRRGLRLAVTFVALGWFYGWASVRAYPAHRPLGLPHGALHGALMPMALPSLLLGQDVPIYSETNNGRPYKIGYIIGINVCGLVVFGAAFAGPKPQRHQLRKISNTSTRPPAQ